MVGNIAGWLESELQAQKRFVLSALSIGAALLLRWRGCLKREDSVPFAKVVFNVFFPALLFGKIAKTEFSAYLMSVGYASMLVHSMMALAVVPLARFVPAHQGFRGQWAMNMMGCNIGFAYPFILSVGDVADDLFSALVVWDLMGNCFVIFIANAVVALVYSPQRKGDVKPPPAEEERRLSSPGGSPKVYGLRSPRFQLQAPGTEAVRAPGEASAQGASSVQLEAPGTGAGGAPGVTVPAAAMAMNDCEAPTQDASSPTSPCSNAGTSSNVLPARAAGAGVSPGRPIVAGRARAAFARRTLLTVATNVPLLAMLAGFAMSCSGWRLSPATDGLLEGMAEPFGCLFFILMGLNLSLSSARRAWRWLCLIIVGRMALYTTALGLIWAADVIPQRHSRKAVTLALCCPIAGQTLALVIDHGYDRSLQAALTGTTNMISLVLLQAMLSYG